MGGNRLEHLLGLLPGPVDDKQHIQRVAPAVPPAALLLRPLRARLPAARRALRVVPACAALHAALLSSAVLRAAGRRAVSLAALRRAAAHCLRRPARLLGCSGGGCLCCLCGSRSSGAQLCTDLSHIPGTCKEAEEAPGRARKPRAQPCGARHRASTHPRAHAAAAHMSRAPWPLAAPSLCPKTGQHAWRWFRARWRRPCSPAAPNPGRTDGGMRCPAPISPPAPGNSTSSGCRPSAAPARAASRAA